MAGEKESVDDCLDFTSENFNAELALSSDKVASRCSDAKVFNNLKRYTESLFGSASFQSLNWFPEIFLEDLSKQRSQQQQQKRELAAEGKARGDVKTILPDKGKQHDTKLQEYVHNQHLEETEIDISERRAILLDVGRGKNEQSKTFSSTPHDSAFSSRIETSENDLKVSTLRRGKDADEEFRKVQDQSINVKGATREWSERADKLKGLMSSSVVEKEKEGKLRRKKPDVLKRMEAAQEGPLSILYKCMTKGLKLKVWTRRYKGLRGICIGYLIAFDKHMNLAMIDVDEVYTIEIRTLSSEEQARIKHEKKKEKRNRYRLNKIKREMQLVLDDNNEISDVEFQDEAILKEQTMAEETGNGGTTPAKKWEKGKLKDIAMIEAEKDKGEVSENGSSSKSSYIKKSNLIKGSKSEQSHSLNVGLASENEVNKTSQGKSQDNVSKPSSARCSSSDQENLCTEKGVQLKQDPQSVRDHTAEVQTEVFFDNKTGSARNPGYPDTIGPSRCNFFFFDKKPTNAAVCKPENFLFPLQKRLSFNEKSVKRCTFARFGSYLGTATKQERRSQNIEITAEALLRKEFNEREQLSVKEKDEMTCFSSLNKAISLKTMNETVLSVPSEQGSVLPSPQATPSASSYFDSGKDTNGLMKRGLGDKNSEKGLTDKNVASSALDRTPSDNDVTLERSSKQRKSQATRKHSLRYQLSRLDFPLPKQMSNDDMLEIIENIGIDQRKNDPRIQKLVNNMQIKKNEGESEKSEYESELQVESETEFRVESASEKERKSMVLSVNEKDSLSREKLIGRSTKPKDTSSLAKIEEDASKIRDPRLRARKASAKSTPGGDSKDEEKRIENRADGTLGENEIDKAKEEMSDVQISGIKHPGERQSGSDNESRRALLDEPKRSPTVDFNETIPSLKDVMNENGNHECKEQKLLTGLLFNVSRNAKKVTKQSKEETIVRRNVTPKSGAALTCPPPGHILKRRHVNQLFIRGDNIVLVALN